MCPTLMTLFVTSIFCSMTQLKVIQKENLKFNNDGCVAQTQYCPWGQFFSFKGKLSDFKPLAGQQASAKQRHLNLVRNVPLRRLPIYQVTQNVH